MSGLGVFNRKEFAFAIKQDTKGQPKSIAFVNLQAVIIWR